MKKNLLSYLISFITLQLTAQTLTQQWATNFSGTGENSDKFNSFIIDGGGNVYAGGFTFRQGNGKDFLLVKFNNAGDTLFTRTYDGSGNGNDEIASVTLDNNGEVIVCGTSKTQTQKDITTAKYDANGNLIWLVTYNGGANLDDYGINVLTDGSGNVYTGGYGYNASLNNDFIVIKYSTAGLQQAVAFYNGADNLDDVLNDLAIDGNGNIIATGQTRTAGNKDDYATVKWNSSLTEQWAVTLDNANKTDRSKSVYVDAANNVFITGRSDNGNNDDFVTQKLNGNSGAQMWVKIYNSNGEDQATSIAGNDSLVVVTGTRFNGQQKDIETVAYGITNGTQLWAKQYSGANGKDENANHITINSAGSVVVTGTTNSSTSAIADDDVLILEYDITGLQQGATITGGTWSKSDNGEQSIIDANGNIYTIGALANISTMKDAWLYKQDAGGTALLNKVYNGEGEFTDKAIAVAESGGSIYTTGYTYEYNEDRNFCTIKYDASGNKVWIKTFNGPDSDTDEPIGISADGSGNIYVAGRSKNVANNYDVMVIKYNSNGDTLWTENYDNGMEGDDEPNALAVNTTGDVYVTGVSDNDISLLTNNDFLTVKISSAGSLQWASLFDGNSSGDDKAYTITTDNSGNAYVSGKTWNGTNYDIKTLKYASANGAETQFATYASNLGDDVPSKILLDNNSNVIVAATSDRDASASTNRDFLIVKYNTAGVEQWAQFYNGAGTGDDDLADMAIDGSGNIFATGQSDMDSTFTDNLDYSTVKFSANGNRDWAIQYNGAADADDIANNIALLSNGNLCVTGQSNEGSSGVKKNDATTLLYSPAGIEISKNSFDGPANGTDAGEAILIYNGSIYVSGYGTYSSTTQKDLLTIKYDVLTGITEPSKNRIEVEIYPNPNSGCFTIDLSNATDTNSTLKLMDATGRVLYSSKVISVVSNLQISNLAQGIYFLRLQNDNSFTETKIIVQ